MYSVVLMMSLTGGTEVPEFGHRRSCCGCSGSYSSGCHGGRRCHGGRGCCGGGYGGGCCGGYYGGGCSGGGCYGGGCSGGMAPAGRPQGEPVPRPKKTNATDVATIAVNLPADAKLTIDGQPTVSTSATRLFVSPPLPADRDSHYTMRAEIVRNGQPVAIERQVAVRPGQETRVNFEFASGVALAP